MPKLTVTGIEDLEKKLKKNVTMNDVKKIVKFDGAQLQKKMQENADFTQGYQTGQTKRSIGLEIKNGGMTAESEPTTEYAPYLEYGTRFMDAQPFVKPAFDDVSKQFKNHMEKLVR